MAIKTINKVKVKKLNQSNSERLAFLLRNDIVLRKELGFKSGDYPSGKDMLCEIETWCKSHRATTYAILTDNKAIGMISLSNRSIDGSSAKIGYWIGSNYRNRGFCAQAFSTVLKIASAEGIQELSSTIDPDNVPSREIWKKHGAVAFKAGTGKLQYNLKLSSPTLPCI